ncbi:phosphoadenosine phosphosulfate reductase [Shimia sp. R10_1]|uniref:phosphoadenosine phosphosulfate reductase n=1 Tax=Shimia sp. R10_1 TaxID=2821095 RepID=UPI001ADAB2D1|nr:phosphoadenosine phosphosulfate reductase [Shimia sp. R10_1]MBO9475099.1 phosphoadenosine phosphosulfate reductase [Shimia sp. R10_1]
MQDSPNGFDTPMLGLSKQAWRNQLKQVATQHGQYSALGEDHCAILIEDKPVLLVTFESVESIQKRADTGQPLGWELVKELGWSHLCLLSNGDTWFRDDAVLDHFDKLRDEGFFERFEEVVFYGAGSGGYAAAAFSSVAEDPQVVVVQPQASLAPHLAGWDQRFPKARRLLFDGRYGFAPELAAAADRCFVIYDPRVVLDAMHATLFALENSILLPTPHLGTSIETDLLEMQILYRVLAKAGSGTLSRTAFFKLYRARRGHLPYLNNLLEAVSRKQRPFVSALLCANVARRLKAPRFLRHLNGLARAAEQGRLAG